MKMKYQKTKEEITIYNQRIINDNSKNLNQSLKIKKYWNFFPTPKNLIIKMLEDYKDKPLPNNILEPSAGKGDIIDYLNEASKGNSNLYCYEIVPELQNILKLKPNCKLLGDDFLNHQENIKFDLIIMNPPFDRGVEHVLNAWEILKEGGEIIALLNKHSYFNAYNSHRLKFKALVNNFGKIEDLGTCFDNNSNVERTAKVDVVLVKITRKSDKYYQDLGINLAKYPISAINNAKAEYIIRELDLIEK
jgi:hypothetical protein